MKTLMYTISEGTDIKKTNASKCAKFVTIDILKVLVLNMNRIFVMVFMV